MYSNNKDILYSRISRYFEIDDNEKNDVAARRASSDNLETKVIPAFHRNFQKFLLEASRESWNEDWKISILKSSNPRDNNTITKLNTCERAV